VEEDIFEVVGIFLENQQLFICDMEVPWASGFRNMVRTVGISMDNVMCK
jgi:hypothetical protein